MSGEHGDRARRDALATPPPWLLLVIGGSVALMTALAATDQRLWLYAVALATSLVLIVAGWMENAPYWSARGTALSVDPALALSRTTQVTALAFAWAALAMFAIYVLTPVNWRHGWQYGAAFALFAIGNAIYERRLAAAVGHGGIAANDSVGRIVRVAAIQSVAIIGGLVWLIASGKLATEKGDWAANAIFIAGGLAVAALGGLAVKTHAALTTRSGVEPDA